MFVTTVKRLVKLEYLIIFFLYFAISFMLLKSISGTIFLIIGLVLLLWLGLYPTKTLMLLIILTPFLKIPLIYKPILGIKGTEPFFLFSFLLIIFAIINIRDSQKLSKNQFLFILLFLGIFIWAVLNAIPHMDLINERFVIEGRNKLSTFPFLLKIFIRPLFYFLPFIIILKFIHSAEEIRAIIQAVTISIIILTITIIFLFILKSIDYMDAGEVNMAVKENLGEERNAFATLFIMGFPFLLYKTFFERKVFFYFFIILNLVVIVFLYSRTGYAVILFEILLYLGLTKRIKTLPFFVIIGLIVSGSITSSIINRVQSGIVTGDLDKISAGRTGSQWEPLLLEYINDPQKLFLGNGRFSIVSSKSVAFGWTPDTMLHPHNMYLELLFDTGIIAFTLFMIFLFIIIRKIFKSIKKIPDASLKEYQIAIFISIGGYLISGLTGRSFFPGWENYFFWVLLASGLCIATFKDKKNLATLPTK